MNIHDYMILGHRSTIDGHTWNRFEDRSAIIPPGPNTWDAGCILGVSNAVIHNNEVLVYYAGGNVTHEISWTSHDRIDIDAPIRLRFYLDNADLYSYRFAPVP